MRAKKRRAKARKEERQQTTDKVREKGIEGEKKN